MKRLLIILLSLISVILYANPVEECDTLVKQQEQLDNSSFEEQILIELKSIRSIQDSTFNQRQRSRREWDKKEGKSTSELDAMYSINDNTTPDFWKNGVTFMATLALIIALITLIIAAVTYREQRKTAMNTQKLSKESQMSLLLDYVPMSLHSLAMIDAAKSILEDIDYKGHPDEFSINRIKISYRSLELVMGCSQNQALRSLLGLRRSIEYFTYKVEAAQAQIMNHSISRKTKEEIIERLKKNPIALIHRVLYLVSIIYKNQRLAERILKESLDLEVFYRDEYPPGENENVYVTMDFFKNSDLGEWLNDEDLTRLCRVYNRWVYLSKKSAIIIRNRHF